MHTSSKSLSHIISKSQKRTGGTPLASVGRRNESGVHRALNLQDTPVTEGPDEAASPKTTGAAPFNVRLAFAVSFAYASFIFCRSFFSVTQAALKADPSIRLTDTQANAIITSTAVAFGLSKFPAGILVNNVSPKWALLSFMALTSLVVFAFASGWSDSYDKMFFIALINAIPQAGAYPAATKLVCAGFSPEQHSSVFAFISIGSRVGQLLVAVVLGEVLRRTGDWRAAVRFASVVVLGCIGLVLFLTTGSGSGSGPGSPRAVSPSRKAPKVAEPLSTRLKRLLMNPRFWLVNLASAMLLISKGFDTYAVRYITDVCKAAHPAQCAAAANAASCQCRAYAPQVTAGVSLGIVISLLFGSWVYERLKSGRGLRAVFIVSLCALNLAAASCFFLFTRSVLGTGADLAADVAATDGSGVTLGKMGVLLFLLGFSAGYPFYVPQSMFAVEFGSSDAATVVGCGECVQSVAMASFIVTAERWVPFGRLIDGPVARPPLTTPYFLLPMSLLACSRFAIRDDETTNWVTIMRFIMTAACCAFVLMSGFMHLSYRKSLLKPKQN